MKKLLLPILFFMMFIPIFVNAETCDTDKISISSISIESKSDSVEELDEATASGKIINLNLSMSEVGDNIEYKFVVKNESNEDYKLNKTSLDLNTDYINYSFVTDDNSNIIKANSSKTVYLKVEYKNEVPDEEFESGTYNDNQSMTLNLSTGNSINVPDTLKNPNTGVQSYILIIFVILLISITAYILLKKKDYAKFMTLIVMSAIIIPISVYAICKCDIKVETNVKINKINYNPCNFDGELVQGAEYINGQYTYRYKQERGHYGSWININKDGWGVLYNDDSTNTIANTKACLSINGKPIISLANTFYNYKNLSTIDLTSFDTSKVYNMQSTFESVGYNANSVTLIGLDKIDTSNVENMQNTFTKLGFNSEYVNFGDVSNWNTQKVKNMNAMFSDAAYNAKVFNPGNLDNWKTSNVTSTGSMFSYSGFKSNYWNIGDLSNWDTSKVISMSSMFNCAGYNSEKFNIGDLSNWDTSNVTSMGSMFSDSGFKSNYWNIGDLSNWNTQNVNNMSAMFRRTGYNSDSWNIGDLSNWDTSKVTSMSSMFNWAGRNERDWSIGDLSNWNVSNVTKMDFMFNYAAYNSNTFNIGNLNGWNTTKVSDMSLMFSQAGYNASKEWYIGTLNIYASNISQMFDDLKYPNATINIRRKPTNYSNIFNGYNYKGDKSIIVNYSNQITNIDDIINTKKTYMYALKGNMI